MLSVTVWREASREVIKVKGGYTVGPKPNTAGAVLRGTPGTPTEKRHSEEVAEDRASEKANLAGTLVLAPRFQGGRDQWSRPPAGALLWQPCTLKRSPLSSSWLVPQQQIKPSGMAQPYED